MTDTRAGPGAEAFTLVYRTERNRLRRVAYLMTGQAAVAEELVPLDLPPTGGGGRRGRRGPGRRPAVDLPAGEGWPTFLDRVGQILAEES